VNAVVARREAELGRSRARGSPGPLGAVGAGNLGSLPADGFRALGERKIDALLPVLRAGVHVVLSDVDCVWSSSPLPMFHGQISGFEDFAHADLLVATDCMDPEDDHRNHGCYHDTVDKNTGVLAVRATPNGIAAMAEWRIRLAVGQKDEQDQTTFNDLLDGM
jgi:hypothetical protein